MLYTCQKGRLDLEKQIQHVKDSSEPPKLECGANKIEVGHTAKCGKKIHLPSFIVGTNITVSNLILEL